MLDSRCLIATQETLLPFAALSHRGRVRGNNEDRLAVRFFRTNELTPRPVTLAVLSDGVGGHKFGEVAAQIGISTVQAIFENLTSLNDPATAFHSGLTAANQAILKTSAKKPELAGMSATCMCALVIEHRLHLAYLGDSRAYLLRGRTARQLNYDHTMLEELEGNVLTSVEAKSRAHPLAHVLSRYLGSARPPDVDARIRSGASRSRQSLPDSRSLDMRGGDIILLCSDGLTDMLADVEIRRAVRGRAMQKDAQRLVHCALKKGGHDNISVILIGML